MQKARKNSINSCNSCKEKNLLAHEKIHLIPVKISSVASDDVDDGDDVGDVHVAVGVDVGIAPGGSASHLVDDSDDVGDIDSAVLVYITGKVLVGVADKFKASEVGRFTAVEDIFGYTLPLEGSVVASFVDGINGRFLEFEQRHVGQRAVGIAGNKQLVSKLIDIAEQVVDVGALKIVVVDRIS